MSKNKKPVVLAVLDGWGFSKKSVGNPIANAKKPTIDMLTREYPMALLQASGLAVGMTWGESGNSEVGHLNLGAGRIVEQYLPRISRSIKDESFYNNKALSGAFDYAKENNSKVHIAGLLTSGTAHADISHLIALLELASKKQWKETYLHLFLDGKDSGLEEAPVLIVKLRNEITSGGYGKIATIIGRSFAMDRDNNWKLTQQAYELLANANGDKSDDYLATINNYYEAGRNDTTMPGIVAVESGFTGISSNDALILFNFREDSMKQILKVFVDEQFSFFAPKELKNLYICAMTQYLKDPKVKVAFMPPVVLNSLPEVIENNKKKQLHVTETEKYAHVTYFFNGLKIGEFGNETDIYVESEKGHQKKPAMKSLEIAQKIVEELDKDIYDFVVFNLANADVLAHTGNYQATIEGVEAVDASLGLVVSKVLEKDGVLIVTADHGNAESLVYRGSGEPETKHDDNPVPFYLVGRKYQITNKTSEQNAGEIKEVMGILGDVAPTILEIMGIQQPPEMTGKSLLGLLGLWN